MYSELCGHGDGGAEEEESVEQVQSHRNDGMAHEALIPSTGYQVEERKHAEHGHEHVVIDQGGIACESCGDDVPDECHDEESEEELSRLAREPVWKGMGVPRVLEG